MSEYRYFEYNDGSGDVFMVSSERAAKDYASRPGDFTEVKVVPLDAIVIDRADLPEVKAEGHRYIVKGLEGRTFDDGQDHARLARGHLAVLELERAQMDSAQVKALAGAFYNATGFVPADETLEDIARRLYAEGARMPEVES